MNIDTQGCITGWTGSEADRSELARVNALRGRYVPLVREPNPGLVLAIEERVGQSGTNAHREVERLRATPGCLGAIYLPRRPDPTVCGGRWLPAGWRSFWPDDGRPSCTDGDYLISRAELDAILEQHGLTAAPAAA